MNGSPVTRLLLKARDAGLRLEVEDDTLVVSPADKLTLELREELLRHKPELLKALVWRESDAHALLKDAMAYLSEFYIGAGKPGCSLEDLDAYEAAIDAAFQDRSMFALRVAVREWVQAGVGMFRVKDRDRGAA